VASSSTSLTLGFPTACPLMQPIGFFNQTVPLQPLIPTHLGPFVSVDPASGVATVSAPLPCFQLPLHSRPLPAPTPGLQLSVPATMSYSQTNPAGDLAPMAVASTYSFCSSSPSFVCPGGQSPCLPMFFPSESSFHPSTSPCLSDVSLTLSQVSRFSERSLQNHIDTSFLY
jgi:hypothetical protein